MKTKQETATENTKEVTNNVIQLTSELCLIIKRHQHHATSQRF